MIPIFFNFLFKRKFDRLAIGKWYNNNGTKVDCQIKEFDWEGRCQVLVQFIERFEKWGFYDKVISVCNWQFLYPR